MQIAIASAVSRAGTYRKHVSSAIFFVFVFPMFFLFFRWMCHPSERDIEKSLTSIRRGENHVESKIKLLCNLASSPLRSKMSGLVPESVLKKRRTQTKITETRVAEASAAAAVCLFLSIGIVSFH